MSHGIQKPPSFSSVARMDRRYFRCLRKVSYGSKKEAKAHQRRVKDNTGVELAVYECEFCFGFHVGNRKGGLSL